MPIPTNHMPSTWGMRDMERWVKHRIIQGNGGRMPSCAEKDVTPDKIFAHQWRKKALFQILSHKYFFAFVDKKRTFHRLDCWTPILFQYHHRCMWTVIQIYRNLYFAHWVWINNLDRNIRIPHFSAQLCSIRSPSTGMCVIYMEI